MLTTLAQLDIGFSETSVGFTADKAASWKAGQLVSFIGAANDTKFDNRQKVGAYVSPNAIGVSAFDKLAGETSISVIVGHIWPIRIDPATTTASLVALLNGDYEVSVNASGNVVATGGVLLAGAGGSTYTTLFVGATSIVNQTGGDRYLLCQKYAS